MQFGSITATRSPGCTPSDVSTFATRLAFWSPSTLVCHRPCHRYASYSPNRSMFRSASDARFISEAVRAADDLLHDLGRAATDGAEARVPPCSLHRELLHVSVAT